MELIFDAGDYENQKVESYQLESYTTFRTAMTKPSGEDAHLRHILRYYIARALSKKGEKDIYVLPELTVGDESVSVDVLGVTDGKFTLAFCEPDSVTPETETKLEILKDMEDVETVVLHSIYGEPGNVPDKFKTQLDSGQFRLMAVVPPPFDDVYEYDVWMFEITFRDLFNGE